MVGACDFKEVTISCKLVIRWWSQEPWCISARDSQRRCLCGAKPEPAAHCAGTGHGADVSTAAGCSNWAARPMSLWSNGTFFSTSTCLAWCYLRVVGLPCKMEGFWGFPCRCRTGIADLNGSHLRPAQRLQKVKEERYTAEATLNQLREEMAVLRRKVTQVEGVGSGSRPHKTSNLPKKTPKMFRFFWSPTNFRLIFDQLFGGFLMFSSTYFLLWWPLNRARWARGPGRSRCAAPSSAGGRMCRGGDGAGGAAAKAAGGAAGAGREHVAQLLDAWEILKEKERKKRGKRGKVQWVRIGWSFVFFWMGRWMTLYDKNRYRHEIDEIGGCRYWYFLLT